jgi:anti-anti-sigma factor
VQVTIRLPAASPGLYLRWVEWWRDVERFAAGVAGEAVANVGTGPSEPAVERLLPIHMRLIEVQARDALKKGRSEVAPELTGDPELLDRSLDYSSRRGEWLLGLARSGLNVPKFPAELVSLRERVVDSVRAAMRTPTMAGTPAELIEGEEPGTFSLIGDIDMSNFEALSARLDAELGAGRPLTLDLAGVSFMDSQGLRMLIVMGKRAGEGRLAPVVLLDPSEPVRRVLGIAVPEGIPGVDIRFTGSN